ncbi:MAG: flavodoxin family protein [Desulfatibacillaceae bacterium]
MKVLVTYYSETGNTKKVAEAIHDGLEQVEKNIAPIDEVKDAGAWDLVYVGFPVKGNSVPGKAAAFLKGLPAGRKVGIFATHGSLRGGPLARTAFEYAGSLPQGSRVLGSFGCRGKVPQAVIDSALKNPEFKAWAEEASSASTHPDEADLKDAREWADNILTKARA